MMYEKKQAKKCVKDSKGELKGYYWCHDCDAFHVTKQDQHPTRVKWFEEHGKQFRNKHR